MATPNQVKQALELALSMSQDVHSIDSQDLEKIDLLVKQIGEHFNKLKPLSAPEKLAEHPVDALLKKGKVILKEGRRKQLHLIYDELTAIKVKFLSAKQNQNVTWFPLEFNGDKAAALFLGNSGEWLIEPLSIKGNGELTGEWEGFDLTEFMFMNCPEFDQDEY